MSKRSRRRPTQVDQAQMCRKHGHPFASVKGFCVRCGEKITTQDKREALGILDAQRAHTGTNGRVNP